MNCWKCGSSENLSIKARHRDGSIRIKICRDCRREDYHRQQESKIPVEVEKPVDEDWLNRAMVSQQKLLSKYS